MSHFLVEPSESLLFGPPRSFYAGEAHRIRSQFPPSPLAFQGLIRTRLLLGAQPALDLDGPEARATVERLVGTPSRLPSGWQIRGPFPACSLPAAANEAAVVQPWVPVPRFLLRHPAAHRAPLHAREVRSEHPWLSDLQDDGPDLGLPVLVGRPEIGECLPLDGWIGPANLRFALAGEGGRKWIPGQWGQARPPFVREEFQPGLAIDPDSASARHGLLYFGEALRFDPGCGLMGQLRAGLDAPLSASALAEGAGQAGRRGRLVRFRAVERLDPDWEAVLRGDHLPEEVKEGSRFWLVALTPVRLDDADRWGSPARPLLRSNDARISILAALTGHSFALGGFELASGRPRPNRLYVPAGSAWLIRLDGGTARSRRDALRTLHDRHSLGDPDEAAMGFGHTLVGLAPETKEDHS